MNIILDFLFWKYQFSNIEFPKMLNFWSLSKKLWFSHQKKSDNGPPLKQKKRADAQNWGSTHEKNTQNISLSPPPKCISRMHFSLKLSNEVVGVQVALFAPSHSGIFCLSILNLCLSIPCICLMFFAFVYIFLYILDT